MLYYAPKKVFSFYDFHHQIFPRPLANNRSMQHRYTITFPFLSLGQYAERTHPKLTEKAVPSKKKILNNL